MMTGKLLCVNRFRSIWLILAASFLQFGQTAFATEEVLDQLQVGTQTYKNVTVTTKSKDYIFIVHSAGMTSIRVSELPDETRVKLGYAELTPKPATNNPAAWAKRTFSKLETPQVQGAEQKLASFWNEQLSSIGNRLPPLTPKLIAAVTAGVLLIYFFFCYCCMLICQKTGHNPSVMIFIPMLQAFPLLKAANMSRWWFVGFLIPGINLLSQIVWSVKIARARNMSGLVALGLILPPTSLLAFLYLAFSSGVPEPKKVARPVQVMTLETA